MSQAIKTRDYYDDDHNHWITTQATAGCDITLWQDDLNPEENHHKAAEVFAARKEWKAKIHSGQLHTGDWAHTLEFPKR